MAFGRSRVVPAGLVQEAQFVQRVGLLALAVKVAQLLECLLLAGPSGRVIAGAPLNDPQLDASLSQVEAVGVLPVDSDGLPEFASGGRVITGQAVDDA